LSISKAINRVPDYHPGILLRNGHFNTVYPTLFRKLDELPFVRKNVITSDNDFLHVDCLYSNSRRIAILCHGLEGSSSSKYITGSSSILYENGWDVAAVNYRFCSGTINKQLRMYHSGATEDLEEVVNYFQNDYDEIALVGFSLGGNLVLKYCGERSVNLNSKIKAVMGFSVPTNLHAGSLNISRRSNYIYQKKFLISLFEKLHLKKKQYPDSIDLELIKNIKTLFDFDDKITGPLHGFADAKDYYKQCSCEQFLHQIKIPAAIVNALNDPFLPKECYPTEVVKQNKMIKLITPKYGGHVGFVLGKEKYYWSEKLILNFLNEKSEIV